jgi:hypothetical protein
VQHTAQRTAATPNTTRITHDATPQQRHSQLSPHRSRAIGRRLE